MSQQPVGRHHGVSGRGRERRNSPHDFPGYAERFPARHQQPELRAGLEQCVRQRGDRVDDVLGVVEHHQRRTLRPELSAEDRDRVDPRDGWNEPDRVHQPLAQLSPRRQLGQLHPPRTTLVQIDRIHCGLLGQAGLARPTGPGERDQPVTLEDSADLGQLALASHQ